MKRENDTIHEKGATKVKRLENVESTGSNTGFLNFRFSQSEGNFVSSAGCFTPLSSKSSAKTDLDLVLNTEKLRKNSLKCLIFSGLLEMNQCYATKFNQFLHVLYVYFSTSISYLHFFKRNFCIVIFF